MAVLQELIDQIDDPILRERISKETDKLIKSKKFGLVFEEHLPECTPLYDVPVKVGSLVSMKGERANDIYTVIEINGDKVLCDHRETHEQKTFHIDEIVSIAEFGDPIYPYLKPVDSVCNAPDSDLWHTLIEADNYHALQLLEYLYAGRVDCIYIDPPYNTGAKDWKYNNDYVDSSDSYRHSKWLSMMERRLKLAKKLLSKDGALITTIDDNELATLRLLLEEIFPEAMSAIISIQMNPGGTQGHAFSVTNEYAIITYYRETTIYRKKHTGEDVYNLRRWGSTSNRYEGATCFYPIILDDEDNIIGFGDVLSDNIHPTCQVEIKEDGEKLVWPIDVKGKEKKWRYARNTVESIRDRLFVRHNGDRIEVMIRRETEPPKTMWVEDEYNSEAYGTKLLKAIIGKGKFTYPKSLYATKDCLSLVVSGKPNALIVDFFAGSGTTLHAVNLLNAEDGGHRRCIMVTNNEVSDSEEKELKKQGYKPGDDEWEQYGIARYVTWPRTVCSIEGHDINGQPLKGEYLGSDIPMADGFESNVAYFKLGFLDKTAVAFGWQFAELVPVLWMKAGASGKCPKLDTGDLPKMMVLPENKFAVLIDEQEYAQFMRNVEKYPEIQTVYIITDSDAAYTEMIKGFEDKDTYQLYRDYLDNFCINTGR